MLFNSNGTCGRVRSFSPRSSVEGGLHERGGGAWLLRGRGRDQVGRDSRKVEGAWYSVSKRGGATWESASSVSIFWLNWIERLAFRSIGWRFESVGDSFQAKVFPRQQCDSVLIPDPATGIRAPEGPQDPEVFIHE